MRKKYQIKSHFVKHENKENITDYDSKKLQQPRKEKRRNSLNCKNIKIEQIDTKQVIVDYYNNPFIKKKLQYFFERQKSLLNQKIPLLQDFECSKEFQQVDCVRQRMRSLDQTRIKKLQKIAKQLKLPL